MEIANINTTSIPAHKYSHKRRTDSKPTQQVWLGGLQWYLHNSSMLSDGTRFDHLTPDIFNACFSLTLVSD